MKPSHIFWGVFFIAIGGLILLGNTAGLDFTWNSAWKFWPSVLVLIGISILVKNQVGKGIIAAAAALISALTIYASISATTNLIDDDFEIHLGDEDAKYDTTYFSHDYSDSIKTASLHFSSGAGGFKILTTTDKLIDFKTEGVKDNYNLRRDDAGDRTSIDFEMKNKTIKIGKGNYKNSVEMSLNPKPEWDLYFEVGASSLDLDLTPYKLNKLDIEMGAAALNVKLGNIADVQRVTVNAGASDIDILIPDSVGCEINSDAALSSRNYEGFTKVKDDLYRSENFEKYPKKIYIEIDCVVSSIDVKKY